MQQFRPLPRFDKEPVRAPSIDTQPTLVPFIDAQPTWVPPVDTPPAWVPPANTSPRVTASAPSVDTPPAWAPPADTSPRVTASALPIPGVSPNVTDRVPAVPVTRPRSIPVTDRVVAQPKKPIPPAIRPNLLDALESTMDAASSTSRYVVIPADMKRKRAAKGTPIKRLKPRARHLLVLFATLGIVVGTLATLVPLSTGQNGMGLLDAFGNWMHSAQMDAQIQAHMNDLNLNVNPANLPAIHIPDSPYITIAEKDALNAGIPPVYFVRQIFQESGFNPNAISVTGAEGIAQFEPATAAGLGIDPFDPVMALNGASQVMARYYHQYGDYAKALGAYNAGPGTVQSATNACGVNWLSCMPGQTQHYVYVIMGI